MVSEQKRAVLGHYNEGLSFYRNRKWDEAMAEFTKALEIDAADGPSECYLKRCREYKKNPPPPDWDGVFTMTTK
ncbi:MAG TPA: tetratricopeptide repeat protein [Spirochaetota bacterium]|nr:tetratricopeptide repeat protein [Spirochaetota bacterium]